MVCLFLNHQPCTLFCLVTSSVPFLCTLPSGLCKGRFIFSFVADILLPTLRPQGCGDGCVEIRILAPQAFIVDLVTFVLLTSSYWQYLVGSCALLSL